MVMMIVTRASWTNLQQRRGGKISRKRRPRSRPRSRPRNLARNRLSGDIADNDELYSLSSSLVVVGAVVEDAVAVR